MMYSISNSSGDAEFLPSLASTQLDSNTMEGEEGVQNDNPPDEDYACDNMETLIPEEEEPVEYEVALERLGLGFFHGLLLICNCIVLLSFTLEYYSVFQVIYFSREDFKDKSESERNLHTILFPVVSCAALLGSIFWGVVADAMGRKTALVTLLIFAGLFGFVSAFAPTTWMLVVFRFFTNFGISGTFPVIISYTSEFVRNKYRGQFLSIQYIFLALGSLFTFALVFAIYPEMTVSFGSEDISTWRVFVAATSLPSLLCAGLFMFLPESPRFLLEVNKQDKAIKALKLAHKLNLFCRHEKNRYTTKHILIKERALQQTIGSYLRQRNFKEAGLSILKAILKVPDLLRYKYLRQSLLLLVVVFCLSFGTNGFIARNVGHIYNNVYEAQDQRFQEHCIETAKSPVIQWSSLCGCYSVTLQDSIVANIELHTLKLIDIRLSNITFKNVTFKDVVFFDFNFNNVVFETCTFENLNITYPDFTNVTLKNVDIDLNSTCLTIVGITQGHLTLKNVTINGVELESGVETSSDFQRKLIKNTYKHCEWPQFDFTCKTTDDYIELSPTLAFMNMASSLVGSIASAIALYFTTRNFWLASTMCIISFIPFSLYGGSIQPLVYAMAFLNGALLAAALPAITVIIADLYPTSHRATAAGFHFAFDRVGYIAISYIEQLIDGNDPTGRIMMIVFVLATGVAAAIGIPKTTRKTLLK